MTVINRTASAPGITPPAVHGEHGPSHPSPLPERSTRGSGFEGLAPRLAQLTVVPSAGGPPQAPADLRPRVALSAHGLSVPPRTTAGKNQPIANPLAMHLGTQTADGGFVATGKWNGPAAVATASPSRTQPLRHHEAQQAGYQLGAKLNGDPVDHPVDRRRLAQASQTMHQTRLALKHGRGNILQDVELTGGASAQRTMVSYGIQQRLGNDIGWGTALAYGAGSCDQHGGINSRLHAPKLRPGERTQTVYLDQAAMASLNGPTGHTFSEAHGRPRTGWNKQEDGTTQNVAESPPPVVMDSWANGPAVRRGDSVYASLGDAMKPMETFDATSGRQAMDRMLDAQKKFSPGGEGRVVTEAVLAALPAQSLYVEWNEVQVVSPQFAKAAAQNLAQAGRLSADIMAVGAGREAYNLSVGQATKQATLDAIRHEAAHLNHQTRPAVVTPRSPPADPAPTPAA
ncbi:hypothetical protein [Hydrogenophaga soli]